jgi:hypothetical protein
VSVTILDTLSPEDLERWRTLCATRDLIEARVPGLTLTEEECRRVFIDYFATTQELLERYGIEGEEADEAKISAYTGHIYIGSEE